MTGGRYLFFSWPWSLDIYRKTFYRYTSTSCSTNLTFLEPVKFVTFVFSEIVTSKSLEKYVVEECISGSGICGNHSWRSELSYFPLYISAALMAVPVNKWISLVSASCNWNISVAAINEWNTTANHCSVYSEPLVWLDIQQLACQRYIRVLCSIFHTSGWILFLTCF